MIENPNRWMIKLLTFIRMPKAINSPPPFVPFDNGHEPLPEIVHLAGINILFIDSTWWLQKPVKYD